MRRTSFVNICLIILFQLLLLHASCDINTSVNDHDDEFEFEGRLWQIVRYEYSDGSIFEYPVNEGVFKLYHLHGYIDGRFQQYELYYFDDGSQSRSYNSTVYADYTHDGDTYNFADESWLCKVTAEGALCVCIEGESFKDGKIFYEKSSLKPADFTQNLSK